MDIAGKMNAGMSSFAKSMKNGVHNCKVDGKITEQQKRIKLLTREIGNLTLLKLEAGESMSPEIMERYAAIKEAKEAIQTFENERQKTVVICPKCGAKTSVEMKYCGACGVNLSEEREHE